MFKNKVVIITGGSRGLGLATARLFLRKRAKVVITGKTKKHLVAARNELINEGGDLLALKADVSSEQDVIDTVQKTIEMMGSLHILVNNAGKSLIKKVIDTTVHEWNDIFATHMTGTFLMCREVVKYWLNNRQRGKIINVSSVSAKTGSHLATAYTASKCAVIGFTRSLAKELASKGINVNCVCPGAMNTDMFQKGSIDTIAKMFNTSRDAVLKQTLAGIPLGRLLDPEEVAGLIVYLASDEASGITGQSLNISCGYFMQ